MLIKPLFALALLGSSFAFSAPQPTAVEKKGEKFKSFTGKILANKVRIRVKPDLESHIIRQAEKNDLFLIVGESEDFYAIEPPKDTKAYVFRSYILDGVVEANRVNVRLEPHIDAPVIGQLQAGDKVAGQVSPFNHKWLEIAPPKGTRFYVSKEFVASAGGPEYLSLMEKRKKEVEDLLNSAFANATAECKKSYEEMNPDEAISQFQTILRNYLDFPHMINQAKEGLALLKETFLNKKIEFLEGKAELSPTAKEELIAKHKSENRDLFSEVNIDPKLFDKRQLKKEMTHSMRLWDALEESLFVSWSSFHPNKKLDDFYKEQRANATIMTGTVVDYSHPIKDKPGDYILKRNDIPVAFLYSTHVDLEKYKGKTVSVIVSPRPNNHFAFPAYFVLSVE